MLTLEIEGSTHWATYLFYGDVSGLEPDEIEEADKWLADQVPPFYYGPVDMIDESDPWVATATYVFLAT